MTSRTRPNRSLLRYALIPGLLCSLARQAGAQSIVPQGPEFQANTYTANDQSNPAIATNEQGRRVVVWQSGDQLGRAVTQDGAGYGVYAQVYDETGARVGGEFRVNDYTPGHQQNPDVAMAADGRFTVVWESGGQDGSDYGVVARRFSPDGVRLGTEFLVNTTRVGLQYDPSFSMDAAGNEIVVWSSQQPGTAYAQRYDSAGGFIGGEFRVSPDGNLTSARVALLSDGGFIVVGTPQYQSGATVLAIVYGSDGLPVGPPTQVNTTTPTPSGTLLGADVAARSGIGFVVVWEGPAYASTSLNAFARRYDARGIPIGDEFVAGLSTISSRPIPSVDMNALGQFAVAWNVSSTIRGQFFDATGVARGEPFPLSSEVSVARNEVQIAMNATGFVAAWSAVGSPPPQDGDGRGVFGQQFRTAPVASEPGAASRFALALAPNPVGRSGGSVRVTLQEAGPVRLSVIDALGREAAVLVDGTLPAGERVVSLGTSALSPGVYTVRLVAGASRASERLVVIR